VLYPFRSAIQQLLHFVFGRRSEVAVMGADGVELLRKQQAHDLVRDIERLHRLTRTHWGRDDRMGCAQLASDEARSPGGRTSRDSVVHDERSTSGQVYRVSTTSKSRDPRLQCADLIRFDGVHLGLRYAAQSNYFGIEYSYSALTDRAHRHFRVVGQAQLAHDEDIQRQIQRLGNLGRNRNASTRQTEHNTVGTSEAVERLPKPPTGIGAVLKLIHGSTRIRETYRRNRPGAFCVAVMLLLLPQ
jgi:hypothetical protein